MTPASPAFAFQPISPDGADMPLYQAVKQSLLRAIESAAWSPGANLPSELAIAAAMKVSIGTLRRAVDELVAEHVLVRRQGRGTFVARHGGDRSVFRFFHVERADGLRETPAVEFVSFQKLRAEAEPARALALSAGDPVFRIERCLRLQGSAVLHDRLTLPGALFKGLTERRIRERPGTIYQLYQSGFGITVLNAPERARAVSADRETARLLGIAPGQPVMRVARTALTFDDRPVEYRVSFINTARHEYVNRPSATASSPA